jgi:hypothetical protein
MSDEANPSPHADEGRALSERVGHLPERLRRNADNWLPTNDHTLEAHNLLTEAATEIERLHKLLQEPTRGRVFAGWFSELRSGMAFRLWEQGGYEPEPDEVPLYV